MIRALFPISLMLSSVACSSPTDYARKAGVTSDPDAAPTPAATPVAFKTEETQGQWNRSFAYGWPAVVTAQPKLAAMLTAERDRLMAQEKTEWAAAVKDAPADCRGCGDRSYAMEWKVVADTPRYLSLSGEFSSYTGGAHGMYGLRSLVWDRETGTAVDGAGVFRSAQALDDALGPKLCAALDRARAEKRGEPVRSSGGPDAVGFDSCQHVGDATVLVGSAGGRRFDRIGIWFGPYVAGPYAEGAYELNFPVDAAVLKAVKPQYAAAFGAGS